jgi:YihY family inner membrane protein
MAVPRWLIRPWQVLVATIRIYNAIDGEQRAAAFAYYALFSLFPLFALLLTIGSSFVSSPDVIAFIENFLPLDTGQQDLIWKTVQTLEASRGSVGLISMVVFTWCSLRFFQALVRGVNRAWHTKDLPWWQMPIKNLLMIAVISAGLLVGILAPAVLQGVHNALLQAEQFIGRYVPEWNFHILGIVTTWSRYAVSGGVLFGAFALLYKLAPRRKIHFRQVWLASLLVAVMLQALQVAFVNYLPRFVNYNVIYGTVGIIMLLLLWIYFSGMIIILGGCLCAALEKTRRLPTPSN